MLLVGGGKDAGPGSPDGGSAAVVDVGGGVQAEAAVAVLVVVPGEEVPAVCPGGLDGAEPGGEPGPVFQGLELRLRIGVVVAHVRAGVGLGDAEVGEQQCDGLGGHRGAAVGVDGQLPAGNALPGHGLGDQPLGQGGGLAGGDHPAGDIAAVNVEDHVQVVV